MNRWTAGLLAVLFHAGLHAEIQQVTPGLVEVEDADTLSVEVAGVLYRVQLPDVDTPESVQNPKLLRDVERTGLDADVLLPLGRMADEWVRQQLKSFKPYSLHFDPTRRDKYGRVPGDLFAADGRRLSTLVVEAGYGVPVGRLQAARQQELFDASTGARQERRGLWGSHAEAFAAWADVAVAPGRR
jgi:endonuclease YncB( thermonuclease family)